jgi:hypothetical protein
MTHLVNTRIRAKVNCVANKEQKQTIRYNISDLKQTEVRME